MPICEPWRWYIYLQNWVILLGYMQVFQNQKEHMGISSTINYELFYRFIDL